MYTTGRVFLRFHPLLVSGHVSASFLAPVLFYKKKGRSSREETRRIPLRCVNYTGSKFGLKVPFPSFLYYPLVTGHHFQGKTDELKYMNDSLGQRRKKQKWGFEARQTRKEMGRQQQMTPSFLLRLTLCRLKLPEERSRDLSPIPLSRYVCELSSKLK